MTHWHYRDYKGNWQPVLFTGGDMKKLIARAVRMMAMGFQMRLMDFDPEAAGRKESE